MRINTESLAVEDHESDIRVDPSSLTTMGEISVYVIRGRSVPGTERNKKPHAAPEIRSVEKVNEKALKGRDLTHVTKCAPQPHMPEAPALKQLMCVKYRLGLRKSLGIMRGTRTVITTMDYDSIQTPFIHFRFLYRSKSTTWPSYISSFTSYRHC